jgi:hypothetical protein
VRKVAVYRRRCDENDEPLTADNLLPASVVIYSQEDAEQLEELLPQILGQDYPTPFEVIVVNEGESADVRDLVAMLQLKNHNLYLTFTPDGARNLSRKKLALTLGVKAARNEVVVLTTSAAIIDSPYWLRRMMYRFSDKSVEVVLGAAVANPGDDRQLGFRRRAFDSANDAVKWLAAAIAGHPYRGTEYNLAYRREVFFRNKGFSHSLNLHYGDDDIFISEIADGDNTQVELSEESIVKVRYGNNPRVYKERAMRHSFTERRIRRKPRFLHHLSGLLQVVALVALIAAVVLDYANPVVDSVAGVLFVLMLLLDILVWRQAMRAVSALKLMITIPYFTVTLPFRKAILSIHSRLSRHKKYTWD